MIGHCRKPGETSMSKIDEVVERVERLLVRHAELQRAQKLTEDQLRAVIQDRDSLRSRLNAARGRIESLLDRLPSEPMPVEMPAAERRPVS